MGHEYRLIFDNASLMSSFIDSLKSSEACIKAREREVYLKDQFLKTVAEYDAKLILEGDFSIWLEVNFRSMELYELVQKALSGGVARYYEDDNLNDEVNLKEVFRIKVRS
jgi:antitoxin component YwqK of YwqJK toxin-antitoxin module